MTSIKLRCPTSTFTPITECTLPPISQLTTGTWHVLHTTLPLWKDKRNVKINYTPLEPTKTQCNRLNDTITYQTLTSETIKSIHGIDTAPHPRRPLGQQEEGEEEKGGAATAEWNWRGLGWLKIASSHWEILGSGKCADEEGGTGTEWCVIWFEKTLFSPMGIDILCKGKRLGEGVVEGMKDALAGLEHEGVKGLVGRFFAVRHDD